MKVAVRYQSRGGNTRAVAEVIAETVGVKAEAIDVPLSEKVDVLFIGGGNYKFDVDPKLKAYLIGLNPKQIGQAVAFATAGSMKSVLDKITDACEKAGVKVNDHKLCIQMLLRGNSLLGLKGGHLSEKQIATVKEFTNATLKNLNE